MTNYFIMCRSLTFAQRGARLLERAGIFASLMRAPQGLGAEGCAYCLKITERRVSEAVGIIRGAGLGPGRIYKSDGQEGYIEVSV